MWRPKVWIKGTVWYKFSDGRYWQKQQRIRTERLLKTKVTALETPKSSYLPFSCSLCRGVCVLCIPKWGLFFPWIPRTLTLLQTEPRFALTFSLFLQALWWAWTLEKQSWDCGCAHPAGSWMESQTVIKGMLSAVDEALGNRQKQRSVPDRLQRAKTGSRRDLEAWILLCWGLCLGTKM